jgi:stage II sporulation protein M
LNVKIPGPTDFFRYVRGLKYYLLVIVVIFTLFYLLGYVAAMMMPDTGNQVISNFKEDVTPLKQLSPLGLMLGIFLNNALKCLLAVVLGLFFGILPALFIMANGLVLGVVIGITMRNSGLLYVLVGTVPHGIIEIPMVFISSAIGLKLGIDVLYKLIKGRAGLSGDIKEGLTMFLIYILPLLFLAAFIETFVTGPILYLIFGA